MSRVLVTGGSGFIGMPLVARLARTDAEVHVVSRSSSPPQLDGVAWHSLDLADRPALEALLRDLRPERLLHTAWYVEHGRFWNAPENVPWVENSLHLLRTFASAGGRRAVMLGTCAEYDWSAADEPLNESRSPIGPSSLYGVAKDALRRLALAYAAREGVELAWGRLFFLYGPREAPERLVASVIRALLAGEPAETSSGGPRRDFLHVDDVAQATLELLDSPVVGPVNIGSGTPLRLSDLVDVIARELGRAELVHRGALADRPDEPELLLADISRLRDEVGFRPQISLDEGIRDTIRWWARGPSFDR
jgi:nucleoside-diphosphate-sugar epimerase